MKKSILLTFVLAAGISFSACDGKKKNEEKQEENVEVVNVDNNAIYTDVYEYHSGDGRDIALKFPNDGSDKVLLVEGDQEQVLTLVKHEGSHYVYANDAVNIQFDERKDELSYLEDNNSSTFMLVNPITRYFKAKNKSQDEMILVIRHLENESVGDVTYKGETKRLKLESAATHAATFKADDMELNTKDNSATLKIGNETIKFEEVSK